MTFCDFVVKYDPNKDTQRDLTIKILKSIIINRLKAHKPAVLFMGGGSGEGKSFSNIAIQEMLMEAQGLDVRDYFDVMNVYTPLEYPQKLEKILHDKEFKKCNIICIHEAREVVRAKNWHSFMTQAIADVNAMSRTIKRLCIIVTSQFIRDITTDIRYTLNYYCIVRRPKGKRARLYINVLWKDDRDLEKPKLRKRKLSGYLVMPNGRYRRFVPQYFELKKPSDDLIEKFDKADKESKADIIRQKLNKLINEMQLDIGVENNKVKDMVDFYSNNLENLPLIGKRYRGKWKLRPEARSMHDLTKEEAKKFESRMNDKLKELELVANDDVG